MKKVLLLTCLLGSTIASFAQYSLSGASPYVQNFSTLGSGLPTGWKGYSGSSATSIGTQGIYSPVVSNAVYRDTTCSNVTGGFKNLPSANDSTMAGASCIAQQAATDRALGVRQVTAANTSNPNLDSGAAFVFQVTNTVGISNLSCTFKLQS
ncbi:MAG: hypothetical protein H7257_14380 [Taibaiella sp.]|nr:hypothetical protein [Taibaiella sp.]